MQHHAWKISLNKMSCILDKLHSFLLKYVIYVNIKAKVAVYLPLTAVLSLLCSLFPLPDSYLNYKDNVLNRGFMKPNYIYSSVVLFPYAIVISYAYSKGNLIGVFKNIIRIAVVIFACQVIRRIQPLHDLETTYNHCNQSAMIFRTELMCTSHGYEWVVFQLSGHMLYLFYYSLATMEEMRLYKIWLLYVIGIHEVERLKKPVANTVFQNFTEAEYSKVKFIVTSLNKVVKLWIIVIGFYIILLDFCTLTTLIYFHEIEEKMVGSILAIMTWYILYPFFFTDFIREKISSFVDRDSKSSEMKYREDWYSQEMKQMYYFKRISCTVPFLQPNFDI